MSTETVSHNSVLSNKRDQRDRQKQDGPLNENRQVVMNGATLKCPYAQGPGKLVVDSNEIQLQEQLWGTEMDDKNMHNLQFEGVCSHPKFSGKTPPPCKSVIFLDNWKKIGTTKVQDHTVLVKESYINCDPKPNAITPNTPSDQINSSKPQVLNAYFVAFKNDSTTKKETIEKISEAGLSYTVGVVVETQNLSGKKIKLRIKNGKKNVLGNVDEAIDFIDLNDKTKKSDFEVSVGNYPDLKDNAVFKIMLNQKVNDLSFDLAKKILNDPEKNALVYIEVEASQADTEYYGLAGKTGLRNTFLNGNYFKINYLEQPWVVTARYEQEKKVSEATHCNDIINNYHQINRQYRPAGCVGIANAWCASFVGWCLKQNNYSAQCDPGAYSYGHLNTRYRVGFKKNPTDKTKLTKEEFDNPVWAKQATKNSLGSICVVSNGKHVTLAVAKDEAGKVLYLGGNQGNSVTISPFSGLKSSVYPIEYNERENDKDLPIYYASIKETSAT